MKKRIAILISFCLSITLIQAQSGKLKKADDYFDKIAYAPAAELYEELIGSEVDSPVLKSRLAYCYYQMGEVQKAESVYTRMLETEVKDPYDYYYYAQVLKENGKYKESDDMMKKFHAQVSNDSRGREFIENENYISKIEKTGNKFSIKNLEVNTAADEFGGYAYNQQTYFISNRKNKVSVRYTWAWSNQRFLDLYQADMDSAHQMINLKAHTKKVNTRFHEGPICFSPDGKTVYYTRNNIAAGKERRDNKGIQNLKIYVAEVSSPENWINEKEFTYNSREYSIGHPSVSPDGKYLYFASDMPGGLGGADIYRCTIEANGQYGKPENLGSKINTEGQDMFPFLNNENLLFFSSDGHLGLGGLDVYVGIPDKQNNYNKILNVGKPVNSRRDDFAFTMDQKARNGYFSSNREEGKGSDDIYAWQLDKPFKAGIFLRGIVTDKENGQPLANARIELRNTVGEVVATIVTNETGSYELPLDDGIDYQLFAEQEKYTSSSESLTTKGVDPGEIIRDFALNKIPDISLYCLVVDADTRFPIEGVRVSIYDLKSRTEFPIMSTGEYGDFFKALEKAKVGDELDYRIIVEKEGYVTRTHIFNYHIEREGKINLHEFLDFTLGKPKIGTDLSTLIDINPIYFDLGKYVIRPDAATELDKIVDVMNKYPTMVVELGSHTDCRSSKAFNLKLSDNRAKASAAYIKSRISNPARIYGKGYGESKLKNGCACEGKVKSSCSEEEHQENRRTEFIIKKM